MNVLFGGERTVITLSFLYLFYLHKWKGSQGGKGNGDTGSIRLFRVRENYIF